MVSKTTLFIQNAFVTICLVAVTTSSILNNSCSGRCGQTGTVPGAPCQCNIVCEQYNDCCPDYNKLCLGQTESCAGRCDQKGTVPGTCQCNKPCEEYEDCCPDYSDVCNPSDGISDRELEALGEQLINLDTVNNATEFIQLNQQEKTSRDSRNDVAEKPLLTVSPAAFALQTIQKLRALHDNYNPSTSITETYTPEEEEEINSFINAIFNTTVMQAAQEFLVSKNLPNGRENFYELWFELFTRGNRVISSSGFEHVFLGEIRSKGVSGFHSWEYFAVEEEANKLNYFGYMEFIDLGSKGSIIEHQFTWQGKRKPVSSMFIGTSPEFELAIYTVCFHARPNTKCPVSLNGRKIKIQTWTRGQHVASAYPDLSD